MKAVTHRYTLATTVFVVATLVFGVPLIGALECLFAFLLASTIITAFQRRNQVRASGPGAHSSAARIRTGAATPARHPRGTRRSGIQPKPIREDEISGYGWPVRRAFE
jgi:hypothetical protein